MKKHLSRSLQYLKNKWKYRQPKYDKNNEPHFLFIATMHGSGSTALTDFFATSQKITELNPSAEGMKLVPGYRKNPFGYLDYGLIKAIWLRRFQDLQKSQPEISMVVDKTPENIWKIERLAKCFKSASVLANIRNPYAFCASNLHRTLQKTGNASNHSRIQILEKAAKRWLKKAERIQNLVLTQNIPLITYEQFCANPMSVLDLVDLPEGVKEGIDPDPEIWVKDYEKSKIIDQNPRQIALLNDAEIEKISEILKSKNELVAFFGYEIL